MFGNNHQVDESPLLGDTSVGMSTSVGQFSFYLFFVRIINSIFGAGFENCSSFFLISILRTALIFKKKFEKSNQANFKVNDFHRILNLDLIIILQIIILHFFKFFFSFLTISIFNFSL